jgi:hypothetical protein
MFQLKTKQTLLILELHIVFSKKLVLQHMMQIENVYCKTSLEKLTISKINFKGDFQILSVFLVLKLFCLSFLACHAHKDD